MTSAIVPDGGGKEIKFEFFVRRRNLNSRILQEHPSRRDLRYRRFR